MAKRQAYLMIRPGDQDHQKTVGGYHTREPHDKLRKGDGQFGDEFSDSGGFIVRALGEAKRLSGLLGWDWRQVTCHKEEIEPLAAVQRDQPHIFYGSGGQPTLRETLEALDYEAIKAQAKAVSEAVGEKIHLNSKKDELISFIVSHQ